MKTAMTELIEHLDDEMKQKGIIPNWDMYLEKEKEQIIDAFEVGYKSCDIDEAFEINRKLASGDLYYNMKYNQNK